MRAHALAQRPRSRNLRWQPMAAAAVILVLIGATVAFLPGRGLFIPTRQAQPMAIAAIQYASARGEVKTVNLPDGSIMTLDADSAAVGQFAGGARSVRLQRGRAFFEVRHDPSHPFAVAAGDRQVVAVGTKFDVDIAAGTLSVNLLEGRITVGADHAANPVVLQPGQQFVRRAGQDSIRNLGALAGDAPSWRSGLLGFDDQPLSEAAAVMNRYSSVQIVVDDPKVAAIRVSGQFRAGDPARFTETLSEMHGLRTVRRGAEIELKPGA
jgi:transmembrane sensor